MGVQAGGFDKGEDGGLMKLTAKSTAGFIFSLSIGSGGGFPGGSLVKNPPAKQETHSDLSDGKIPWRRQWHPLQYSCLGNPMDCGAWWATVHGVPKSQKQPSN